MFKKNSDKNHSTNHSTIVVRCLAIGEPPTQSIGAQRMCDYGTKLASAEISDRLERIARRQTQGSQVDWEDALQSALIKLLEKLDIGNFNGDESNFMHWASIVAKHYIIDLVRTARRRDCFQSLDQKLAGTDQTLLETVPDPLNESAALEQLDLMLKARIAICKLDQIYPQRQYLKLWQGLIQQKSQSQIALELGMKRQSDVSRRKNEIITKLAIELGAVASSQSKSKF